MIFDATGNLIVGVEPGGYVLRITPERKSFVLFQTGKREVTAVAEHDGVLYAAANGSRPLQMPYACAGHSAGRSGIWRPGAEALGNHPARASFTGHLAAANAASAGGWIFTESNRMGMQRRYGVRRQT